MPLVRFEVRNEYGLGDPELHRASPAARIKDGDSKALLDGVAVTGLVGLLRQLGDLAEFAADVFHDLHEQVAATAARRRKILSRIQNVEAALPSVEKAIKEQKSHIHFAYVGGCDWHAHIRENQSLLLSTELPRYMMDSYEECHDPPRLYLLDKFEHGGNGACLKRYSDPSYFRRVWALSESEKAENTPRKKKSHTMKRKGSRLQVSEFQHGADMSRQDSRINNSKSRTRFASLSMDGHSSENSFSEEMRANVEPLSQSTNFAFKARESYGQQALGVNSELPDDVEELELSDSVSQQQDYVTHASHMHIKTCADGNDDVLDDSAQEQSVPRSSSVTWDEKTEIIVPEVPSLHNDTLFSSVRDTVNLSMKYDHPINEDSRNELLKDADILFDTDKVPISLGMSHFDEVTSDTDNFLDALNTMESETDTEGEDLTKLRTKSSVFSQVTEPHTENKEDITLLNPDLSDSGSPKASLLTVDPQAPRVSDLSSEISGCLQQPVNLAESQEFSAADGTPGCNIHDGLCECYIHNVLETKNHEEFDIVHSQSNTPDAQVTVHHDSSTKKSELKNLSPSCTSGLPTVQLWTNGVLFGVEPSKPPDLGLLNVSCEEVSSDLGNSASKLSGYMIKPQTVVNDYEADEDASTYHKSSIGSELLSGHDVQQNDSSQYSPPFRDACTGDTYLKQGFPLSNQSLSLDEASINGSHPTTTNGAVGLNGSSQSTGVITSTFSDLAHRFLSNTLQRKTLLATTSTSESSFVTNCNEKIEKNCEKNQHTPSGFDYTVNSGQRADENVSAGSSHKIFSTSHYSGKSSPPLEHMKISFQPMNGTEASKVKQNISSGSACESIDDYLIPSYQLFQGPIGDNFYDSDDDTFCKSCPYSSDEPLTPVSYSNSELWEQDESEHNNNDICDTLEMSSLTMDYLTSNIPSELQNIDVKGHKETMISESSVCELPNLDSILSVRYAQEGTCNLPNNPPCSIEQKQDQPPLPPPPAQWRILKSSIASPIDCANNFSRSDHIQAPTSSSEQQKHSEKSLSDFELIMPLKNELKLNGEEPIHVFGNQKDHAREDLFREIKSKMLNGHNNINFDSAITNKEVDERDELLHQIRNKSFNLRRTVTSKAKALPRSSTNVANANVTAMLKKATAIRQAFVSSDEAGDDENWSDG